MPTRQSPRVGKGGVGPRKEIGRTGVCYGPVRGKHRKHIEANMTVTTAQEQIAELAKRYPERGLTSLNKCLDEEWLRAAFGRIRKDGATGIDGESAREYEKDLDGRLPDLVNRAKSGNYRAPAVRRTYIDKPGKRDEKHRSESRRPKTRCFRKPWSC